MDSECCLGAFFRIFVTLFLENCWRDREKYNFFFMSIKTTHVPKIMKIWDGQIKGLGWIKKYWPYN